jgi:apolipoprotein N-acyltransferase
LPGLIGGCAYALAFSPWGFPVLSVLGLAALCLLCLQQRSLAIAGAAIWGTVAFGIGTAWLYPALAHASLDTPAKVSIFAFSVAWQAVFPLLLVSALRLAFAREALRLLAFPAAWTLQELLRAQMPYGFHWLFGGYAHVDSLLAHAAPLAGVWGVGLLAAMLAALLVHAFRTGRAWWALPLCIALCWPVGGLLAASDADTREDRVAVVQSRFQQHQQRDPDLVGLMTDQYKAWTQEAIDRDATLVVWPEAALPLPAPRLVGFLQSVDQLTRANNTALMAGLLLEATGQHFNAMIGLGTANGRTDKFALAPLGEYVPPVLESMGLRAAAQYPLSRSNEHGPIRIGDHAWGVVAICYEIADVALVRARTRRMGDQSGYLVFASDENWFAGTWEPFQQLQMARMRALETGLFVLRSTNAGHAAVIDPSGRLRVQGDADFNGILIAQASPARAETPWVRWGATPLIIALLAFLAAVLMHNRGR